MGQTEGKDPQMKSFKDLREKTLTPAEKKKREEIAKAMERENPGMDMKKKMAIATWQAKKVAEEKIDEGSAELKTAFRKGQIDRKRTLAGKPQAGIKGDSKEVDAYSKGQAAVGKKDSLAEPRAKNWQGRPMKKTIAKTSMKKEEVELDEALMSGKEKEAFESGKKAARAGQAYKDNPHSDSKLKLAWSKGHNKAKARKLGVREEAKIDEISLSHLSNKIANSTGTKNIKTAMKPGEVKKGLDDLKKRLNTLGKEPKMAKEAYEEEPASPDEKSMAMRQAKFIQYVGDEIMEHLEQDGDFPEWMQNKLSEFHQKAKDMHSTMAGSYEDDEKKMDESTKLDEILDTPKAMDSYRNKAKASKEKAASSAVAKMVRSKDKDNREHPAAELKTMAKRTAGEKMADRLAKRKTFKKLRNEDVMSADKKPEKYIKPDGKVGIRMVRTDKKVVDKDA